MAAVVDARGPVVIRRRLGAALRQLRTDQGHHLQDVARELEISPSKLSRLESGHVAPRIRDVRDLLQLYGVAPEARSSLMDLAHEAREPGWWQPFAPAVPADLDFYISLEAEAKRLRIYSANISGLLQTEAYARMLLTGAAHHATPEQLEKLVDVRVRRHAVLEPDRSGAPPLHLHAVLDEAALHRGPQGALMEQQLAEVLRRSERPNVVVQVLPFEQGYVPASTFAIFEPRVQADGIVVNVESTGQDAYYDSADEVAKYESIWKGVTDRCLTPEASDSLIRDVLDSRRRREASRPR